MKIDSLKPAQIILLTNWIVLPLLGIWIWVRRGFLSTLLFMIIWWIADAIWDWLSGVLILGAGKIGLNEHEEHQFEMSEEVPKRVAIMMIIDLLGTIIIPLIIAGSFLHWFW